MADKVIRVSNSEQLMTALRGATGGETIKLRGGDYGALDLRDGRNGFSGDFASEVTIVSKNIDNPATFSTLNVKGVSNLTLDGLVFDHTFVEGDPDWLKRFKIWDSSDIKVTNSVFDGDLAFGTGTEADYHGTGMGLEVSNSSNIKVNGNEFFNWRIALQIRDSQDVKVRGNEIHDIRTDGMEFIQNQGLLIEGNYIHDFNVARSLGDHADMIQFWTNGTTVAATDATIRGNILDVGDGDVTQSIFMRNDMVDQGKAGYELYYRDFLIEDNVILGGHAHGISIGEIDGLVIRNNSILSIENPDLTPAININSVSKNVTIEQNAVALITGYGDQNDWTVRDNALIQRDDPDAAGYYGTEFLESSMQSPDGASGWVVDPNGTIAQLGAGASMLLSPETASGLRAVFDVATDPGDDATLVFDASVYGPDGLVEDPNAVFKWDFGDGTTATGRQAAHLYTEPGDYKVKLKVVGADGTSTLTRSEIAVAGEDLLTFQREDGLFHTHGYGEDSAIAGSDAASVVGDTGAAALDLGDEGTQLAIDREAFSRFFGAEGFELSFSLRADTLGSTGEVFRLHNAFIASVAANGKLSFQFFPDDGERVTLTSARSINDGRDHDVTVRFDDDADRLTLEVDGIEVSRAEITGSAPEVGYWNLTFGNPWGAENFDGSLDAFDLDAQNNDYPFWEEAWANTDEFVFPGKPDATNNGGARVAYASSSEDRSRFSEGFDDDDFSGFAVPIPPDDSFFS